MLFIKPYLVKKPWAGNSIKDIFNRKEDYNSIGESWEFSEYNKITNGKYRNMTIKELIDSSDCEKIFGKKYNNLPIIVKFIDTCEWLSVQVHPNDNQALLENNTKQFKLISGKTEGWIIIDSHKQSKIINGVNMDESDINSIENINPQIFSTNLVKPGQSMLIKAGTVHSIGPNILLYEIQQHSDITYRVYDWNRGRELHFDKFLHVSNFKQKAIIQDCQNKSYEHIFNTKYFQTYKIHVKNKYKLYTKKSFLVITCIHGHIKINNNIIKLGQTVLIPNYIDEVKIYGKGDIIVSTI